MARFFGWVAKNFEEEQEIILQEQEDSQQETKQESSLLQIEREVLVPAVKKSYRTVPKKQESSRRKKNKEGDIVVHDPRDIRDVMELMEVPFVALSKNRTAPIVYVSPDGKSKVRISRHSEHYLASIYDWDIILFVASKLQGFLNSKEIPPRTLIVPRHELLKALHKHDGKKEEKDLKASLARLKLTGIETTIHNEDGRYEAGFGFLDSWGYTDRKDIKEFRITLSEWLYAVACRNGSLLKIHPEYFKITSGLKRFLYRTARKHVGTQNSSWEFSIERLYKKCGSEQIFRFFKRDLKKAVQDNDIPGYLLEWVEEEGKTLIRFINTRKFAKTALLSSETSPKCAISS